MYMYIYIYIYIYNIDLYTDLLDSPLSSIVNIHDTTDAEQQQFLQLQARALKAFSANKEPSYFQGFCILSFFSFNVSTKHVCVHEIRVHLF